MDDGICDCMAEDINTNALPENDGQKSVMFIDFSIEYQLEKLNKIFELKDVDFSEIEVQTEKYNELSLNMDGLLIIPKLKCFFDAAKYVETFKQVIHRLSLSREYFYDFITRDLTMERIKFDSDFISNMKQAFEANTGDFAALPFSFGKQYSDMARSRIKEKMQANEFFMDPLTCGIMLLMFEEMLSVQTHMGLECMSVFYSLYHGRYDYHFVFDCNDLNYLCAGVKWNYIGSPRIGAPTIYMP